MFAKSLYKWCRICTSGPSISGHYQAVIRNTVCLNSSDATSNGSDEGKKSAPSSDVKKRNAKTVDIIGQEMFTAVKEVAKELHKDDEEMMKKTRMELIERLAQSEKETFDAATASQNNEMLSDNVVVEMLSDINALRPKRASHAAEIRHARRGLVLLRREIFYQAQQNGYTAEQAREIAENAVKIAEERAIAKSKQELAQRMEESKKEDAKIAERSEKEKVLYDYAFRMAEQIFSSSSEAENGASLISADAVEPLLFCTNVFTAKNGNLGIFKQEALPTMKNHCLELWNDLDANAARIWNQLFGPRNGFEEFIEWTKKGKMWPYPINNEYMLGDEEKVPFYEHIFLDKELSKYNLPKTGPVAHFMELVCVGLSKNSYMNIQKKRDHLKWFANFFNEKRVEEINRLHKAEQDLLE